MTTDQKTLVNHTIALIQEALKGESIQKVKVEWKVVGFGGECHQQLVPDVTIKARPTCPECDY